MENWLKILNGDVQTDSVEISTEIERMEQAMESHLSEMEKWKTDLKMIRVQNLGNVNNQDKIQPLEEKVLDLEKQTESYHEAIKRLKAVLAKTLVKENTEDIKVIDEKIIQLQSEEKQAEHRFLEIFGEVAGLWNVIHYNKVEPVFNGNSLPWIVKTDEEVSMYNKAYEKGCQGRATFHSRIIELKRKQDKILKKAS